jgi:hypothetical protein
MSQNSLVLPTTGTVTGLTMVQDMNLALDSLNTNNSGASAPATTEAFQWWVDSTNNLLKMRDETNSTWISLLSTMLGLTMQIGASRDAKMSITAASASGSFTASQVIVGAALNGVTASLQNFSQTVNLGTTGAGGMDTGSAPASGFVALYAIYNPASNLTSILATNASSAVAPAVYGGGSMPSGYTMSALLSVWPTGAGSLFNAGWQNDRTVFLPGPQALSTTTIHSSLTSLSIAGFVPLNARMVSGSLTNSGSTAAIITAAVAGSSGAVGIKSFQSNSASEATCIFENVPLITAQTIYYENNLSTGTTNTSMTLASYVF